MKCNTVRIELAGKADEGKAIVVTEVANQKNVDTGAGGAAKDTLAIVEAEFMKRRPRDVDESVGRVPRVLR